MHNFGSIWQKPGVSFVSTTYCSFDERRAKNEQEKQEVGWRRDSAFHLIVILVGGLVFIGITPKQATTAPAVIKVGIDVGLTGFAAAWGKHAWNTFQLAFDKINSEGGIKVLGRSQDRI